VKRSLPPVDSNERPTGRVREWPPPVGAIVRSPDGTRFEVVDVGRNEHLGRYVVLRCWQTFPVNRERWVQRGYEIDTEA
jgi:hypothetical protein